MGPTRIQKIAKKLIEEAGEDRSLALESHRFFREMVDENPQDSAAKSLMVAQASKNNVVKILTLLTRMDETTPSDKSKSSADGKRNLAFTELDNLTND